MTVADLIEELKKMPQNYEVNILESEKFMMKILRNNNES